MCEKPSIRLKPTRTQESSQNLPGDGQTRRSLPVAINAHGRGLFVLVLALIGAVAGGRWFGLALSVSFSGSGTPFDLANALLALVLLALLYRATGRYAYDVGLSVLGRPVRAPRAFAVTSAFAASSTSLLGL